MSKFADAIVMSYVIVPKITALLFVRAGSWGWFPKRRTRRVRTTDVNPLSLVALAELELAAGHEAEAKLLVEAAYLAFDYKG